MIKKRMIIVSFFTFYSFHFIHNMIKYSITFYGGFMKKTEENKVKKSKKKWIIIGIVIFLFIGVVGSSNDDSSNNKGSEVTPTAKVAEAPTGEPTQKATQKPTEESTQAPTKKPTQAPADIKLEIEDIVKSVVNDNDTSVTYNEYNNFVLVKFKGSENLTNKMTVKGMFMDIKNILEKLKDYDNLDVDFNVTYTMQDTYGNTSDDIVIKASYPDKIRKKINWDNFLWENINTVASEWWMHTALQNALNG